MSKLISGIQQVGIGVPDSPKAFDWYRKHFNMDIRVFEEAAVAEIMLPYTGGTPKRRHAILAINMIGGGGFEIWQHTDHVPGPPKFEIQLGDLGLYVAKMKTPDIKNAYSYFKAKNIEIIGDTFSAPNGKRHFFVKDPYGNVFQIEEFDSFFAEGKNHLGGPSGMIIGVSDIDKALAVYSDILGYDTPVYDKTDVFDDLKALPGGDKKVRRVLLEHSKPREGAFSPMLGASHIELIQAIDYKPRKIFEDRYWGEFGFIHLCFDIIGMDDLRNECKENGFPFTVDSAGSFDMGEAAGIFSYIEDPDGTLIEFVETHKIPILKKIGWYLDLRKRDPKKPLPNWMLKSLRFNRVKD